MRASAASQWGIGFVLHKFRQSTRSKQDRLLVINIGPWRKEFRWTRRPPQLNLFGE